MPPTATLQEIKAYQQKVEKGKITPQNLPPCSKCELDSEYFKIHAYRERRFLVIVKLIVQAVFCPLIRFACPGCGKTVTNYPDFALPYKHYTCKSITGFAAAYVQSEDITYQQAVMVDNSVPGYPQSDKTLAPSTLHRWVGTLGGLVNTTRDALLLVLQENPASSACRDLAHLSISGNKYRSRARKKIVLGCFRLLLVEALFQATFALSIFTKLAIACGFS